MPVVRIVGRYRVLLTTVSQPEPAGGKAKIKLHSHLILQRSEKKRDRVEIAPEQQASGMRHAEISHPTSWCACRFWRLCESVFLLNQVIYLYIYIYIYIYILYIYIFTCGLS
jgi:hypothetical protein